VLTSTTQISTFYYSFVDRTRVDFLGRLEVDLPPQFPFFDTAGYLSSHNSAPTSRAQYLHFDSDFSDIFFNLQKFTYLFIDLSTNPTFTSKRALDHLAQCVNLQDPPPGYPVHDRVCKILAEKLKSCVDGVNLSGFATNGVIGVLMK
jgi:hypothetical protein